MLVVNYNNSRDYITDYFIDTLPCNVRKDAYTNYPCVIVKHQHHNKILTSVMRTCNTFNHFFTHNKLKDFRRCDICLEKQNIFKKCYICEHRCCSNCIKSMSSLVCPFCNYDSLEHHCSMMNSYEITKSRTKLQYIQTRGPWSQDLAPGVCVCVCTYA